MKYYTYSNAELLTMAAELHHLRFNELERVDRKRRIVVDWTGAEYKLPDDWDLA